MNKRIEEKLVLKKSIKKFLNKLLISIILFLLGMILVKNNTSFKQTIKENLYEKNIPFQKIKLLYEKYGGNIFSVKKESKVEAVWHEKISYEKKEDYQKGVKLTVSSNYSVPAIESGVVIFMGEKQDLGNSIIIEQVDGTNTLYANMKTMNIKLYDYLEKGEIIGEVNQNTLYLFFQKKGEYLDYKKYI